MHIKPTVPDKTKADHSGHHRAHRQLWMRPPAGLDSAWFQLTAEAASAGVGRQSQLGGAVNQYCFQSRPARAARVANLGDWVMVAASAARVGLSQLSKPSNGRDQRSCRFRYPSPPDTVAELRVSSIYI